MAAAIPAVTPVDASPSIAFIPPAMLGAVGRILCNGSWERLRTQSVRIEENADEISTEHLGRWHGSTGMRWLVRAPDSSSTTKVRSRVAF